MIFPQAKSQKTLAVVKLKYSSREKREEERRSEGLLPRLGLITRVASIKRVDTLRGLVLLFNRIKQTDPSFEETLISFWGFLIGSLTSLYPKLGDKLHWLSGASSEVPPVQAHQVSSCKGLDDHSVLTVLQ